MVMSMRPVLLPLVQLIIANITNVIRVNKHMEPGAQVPVFQLVSPDCSQLMTTLGGITMLGDHAESDYQTTNIGSPNQWDKVVKGIIKSRTEDKVPFDRAAKIASFSSAMKEDALRLLKDDMPLIPVSQMERPSNTFVFIGSSGRSLNWAYSVDGKSTENMLSEWTSNPLTCQERYGVIRGWHKEILKAFPKDKESEYGKLSGLAVSTLGSFMVLHIVSRPYGMVVTLVCSPNSDGYKDVSYVHGSGQVIGLNCEADGTYTLKKGNDEMKVNLVDLNKIYESKKEPESTAEAVVSPEPAAAAAPETPQQTAEEVTQEPVKQEAQESIAEASQPEHLQQDVQTPETFAQASEDILAQLNEQRDRVKDELNAVKFLQSAVKQLIKLHNSELKAVKAQTKENEELTKMRSAFSSMAKMFEQLKG